MLLFICIVDFQINPASLGRKSGSDLAGHSERHQCGSGREDRAGAARLRCRQLRPQRESRQHEEHDPFDVADVPQADGGSCRFQSLHYATRHGGQGDGAAGRQVPPSPR